MKTSNSRIKCKINLSFLQRILISVKTTIGELEHLVNARAKIDFANLNESQEEEYPESYIQLNKKLQKLVDRMNVSCFVNQLMKATVKDPLRLQNLKPTGNLGKSKREAMNPVEYREIISNALTVKFKFRTDTN